MPNRKQGGREPAEGESRFVAWVVIAGHFAGPFMFSAVAVALPPLGAELSAGASDLGLVETLFLAGSVAFLLPVGRLADVADRRTLYRAGLAIFGLASLAIAASGSMEVILVLRFVQGIGSAVISATGPAILADLVMPERRGRAYGWAIGVTYGGLTLGPLVGGVLISAWGWRAVFVGGAMLLLGAYALLRRYLRSRFQWPPAGALHLPSIGLVVTSVVAVVFGAAFLDRPLLGGSMVAVGLALGAVFTLWQTRLPSPLLDVDALLKNRVLRGALVVQALLYMSAYASLFMLSLYLQAVLGRTPALAGRVLALGTVLMAVCAPIAGALADRLRPALLASVGVASVLLSSLLAVALGPGSELHAVVMVLAAQGIGFAFFSSPNMTLIMNSVPNSAVGGASALGATSRSFGMISGMLMISVLLTLALGDLPVASAPLRFIEVMHSAYSLLAVAGALALVLCLRGFFLARRLSRQG
ncbi:MAG TPA: MFS transporter [Nannocystis exedens]|nr:MFS transporter [Nannocystis exedens]